MHKNTGPTFVDPEFSGRSVITGPNVNPENKIGAQRSGSDFEKEEGDSGYGVFAALTQTAETEWSRLLLTLVGVGRLELPASWSRTKLLSF